MFEFGGHGQDDGTEGVTGSTGGVGGLFRMPALPPLSAARTPAGLDVELGDDGHDGWQIGLILNKDVRIDQFDMAIGTDATGHVDDPIDLLGSGRGPQVGLVSLASARPFFAFLVRAPAKRVGLPVRLALGFVQRGTEAVVVLFQTGAAALHPRDVPVSLPQAVLENSEFAIAQVTAEAIPGARKHGRPHQLFRGLVQIEVIVRGASSSYAAGQDCRGDFREKDLT
jgi:hypothetical protein